MVDKKALKHALVRLRGFRSHIFGSITEPMVDEYHTILIALQEASDEDLTDFLIPRSVLQPHIVGESRQSRSLPASRFEPELTSSIYCDKEFFMERMERLSERFEGS
jgi:hypothetical protein